MPRYGKIHSMPAALQNAASELIQLGKKESEVADWLNETLARATIPGLEPDVTQQNVSAWKKSGYIRWKANNEYQTLSEKEAGQIREKLREHAKTL
jgi:hypothetical protein